MIIQFKLFRMNSKNFQMFEAISKEKVDFEWTNVDGKVYKFKNITIYKDQNFVPMMGVSQVIRQYIKQKWKIPFQIGTESYSGGNSVRIYLNPQKITKDIHDKIKIDLINVFQYGTFDGMTDSYNFHGSKLCVTKNGKEIEFGTKYFLLHHNRQCSTTTISLLLQILVFG